MFTIKKETIGLYHNFSNIAEDVNQRGVLVDLFDGLMDSKKASELYSTPRGKTDKLEEPVNKELNSTRS